MNKKELRYAFNTIINHAEKATCVELHHPKKWQHEEGYVCPAVYHLSKQADIVRKYMTDNEI